MIDWNINYSLGAADADFQKIKVKIEETREVTITEVMLSFQSKIDDKLSKIPMIAEIIDIDIPIAHKVLRNAFQVLSSFTTARKKVVPPAMMSVGIDPISTTVPPDDKTV